MTVLRYDNGINDKIQKLMNNIRKGHDETF